MTLAVSGRYSATLLLFLVKTAAPTEAGPVEGKADQKETSAVDHKTIDKCHCSEALNVFPV